MHSGIKKLDIGIALAAILGVSVMLLTYPRETAMGVAAAKDGAMRVLSPFYLWLGFGILLYCLFLSFSRYGSVRLGRGAPEHPFFRWFIMIFCTGMGSNLLYWSALEWMYYYQAPPLGAQPFSQAAAELAVTYGAFHWGCTGWAIYAVGALTLGLKFFNWNEPRLSLSAGCERALPCLGQGVWARLIELCFLFGTIGGFVTMLGFVVPMYANNVSILLGVESGFRLQALLMLGITAVFTASSWSGLKNGIRRLSAINVALAICILIIALLGGPTTFIIKSVSNSVGFGMQNYVIMSLWTDFIGNSGFPEAWTAFYWAWWIGLAPSMWIFTARISRGRSVRELLLGVILGGSAGCWLYFGIISNSGMFLQLSGITDFVALLNSKGATTAVAELVLSLPGGRGMLVLWTVTGIVFLITTLDSGSYTLALSTTADSRDSERTGRGLRLFWSLVILAVPLGLMYAEASLAALQASAVLTAVPIGFLTIIVIISGWLYVCDAKAGRDPASHNAT